jgi:competence protein ComGC
MRQGLVRDGDSWKARQLCRVHGPRAFTLIELVLCIGILMILLGLLMPTLSGARQRALDTRMVATMKSNGQLLALYAKDQDDRFPLGADSIGSAMLLWYQPLIDVGLIEHVRDVDPDGIKRDNVQRVAMSGAAACLPEQMVPGGTVPIDMARSVAIRQSQVVHPSSKGILVQWVHVLPGEHRMWSYTPANGPISPITFADGSVSRLRCTEFVLDYEFFENWVGHPVISTWSGVRGIDRRGRASVIQ